ncbi:hypothetical protein, partial [Portibacter marinus]|uniref:hypothetical protein n=1 Tax=Portibacter marinus TaxID=2898660 RepID=UPI001F43F481
VRRGEFYLIGNLEKGMIRESWFVNLSVSNSMTLTLRIASVEDVKMSNDESEYKLLIVSGDAQTLELLLALKISSELVQITKEGKD